MSVSSTTPLEPPTPPILALSNVEGSGEPSAGENRAHILISYPRFGTWKIPVGETTIDQVDQAISVGFSHIGALALHPSGGCITYAYPFPTTDTAQAYRNEAEAGKAIRESGLAREDIFVTTKYSGLGGLDIETSIKDSLSKVRPSFCMVYWCSFFFDKEGALWSSTDNEDEAG